MTKKPGIKIEHSPASGFTKAQILVFALIALAIGASIIAVAIKKPYSGNGKELGNEFVYDLESLRPIPEELVKYEEVEAFETNMEVPAAICVTSGGDICVAGDQTVKTFSKNGALRSQISLPGEPNCVAVDSGGKFYAGLGNCVHVYSSKGKELSVWDPPDPGALLTCITISEDHILVADAQEPAVLLYNKRGKLIRKIGKKDPGRNIPGLLVPSPYLDVVVAPDGLLRVTNPGRFRVEAYTIEGDLEFFWGKSSTEVESFCGCCNPVHLAVLPGTGIVTSEKGLITVKVYKILGEELAGVVAGPEALGRGKRGFDIAVDSSKRILVLDTLRKKVRIFARKNGTG